MPQGDTEHYRENLEALVHYAASPQIFLTQCTSPAICRFFISDIVRWEKHLPQNGPVNNACMKLLLEDNIEAEASTKINLDVYDSITVCTATQRVVDFLKSKFESFEIQIYQPEGHLYTLATVAGNVFQNPPH